MGLWELSDTKWEDLLAFCDLAHLTLPLVTACQDEAPGWVLSRVKRNLADNKVRVAANRDRLPGDCPCVSARRCTAPGTQRICSVSGLRGLSRLPHAIGYRSLLSRRRPSRRTSGSQEPGIRADRTSNKFPADHLPQMTRKAGWRWRGNAYDPEMPPAVDLHFCFWNPLNTRFSVKGVDEFWERRIQRQIGDLSFPALCPIDHLAFHALHVLRDLQRGDWVIHHVYELAWFLDSHADDEVFWRTWEACHDDSLRSLQAISFWLAREWFNCRCASSSRSRDVQRFLDRWRDGSRDFPNPLLPACFALISMAYGCTSACSVAMGSAARSQ